MFDILAAVKAAKPGDIVTIPAGEYPALTLSNVVGVTLTGTGVTLERVTLSACEDVVLRGLAVRLQPDEATVSSTSALRIVKCKRLLLQKLSLHCGLAIAGLPQDTDPTVSRTAYGDAIIGLPIGRALTLDGCEEAIVENCDLGDSHKGIVLNNCKGARISGNRIKNTRTGQISAGGVSEIVIEGNWLSESRPWNYGGKGDHGDFIHLWTEPKYQAGQPSTGVVIRGNLIDQGGGAPIIAVLLEDNGGGGFDGAEIANNVVLNGNGQGLAVSNLRGGIDANLMLQTTGTVKHGPSILLRSGSAPAITDNRVHDVYGTIAAMTPPTTNVIVPPGPVSPAEITAAREAWLLAHGFIKPPVDPTPPKVIEISIKPGETVVIRGVLS